MKRSSRYCDTPHPEIEGVVCNKFSHPGEPHSKYTREHGRLEWITECGKKHRGEMVPCEKPAGHDTVERSKARSETKRATFKDLMAALRRRHSHMTGNGEAWAYFEELRIGTGFAGYSYGNDGIAGARADQRIDAWAIHLWPSKRFVRVAYEVKVDKQDFYREVHNPDKRRAALEFSNEFYFVAPKGLIEANDVPEDCGLIEYSVARKTLRVVKEAPWHDGAEPSWRFLASVCRRVARREKGVA